MIAATDRVEATLVRVSDSFASDQYRDSRGMSRLDLCGRGGDAFSTHTQAISSPNPSCKPSTYPCALALAGVLLDS